MRFAALFLPVLFLCSPAVLFPQNIKPVTARIQELQQEGNVFSPVDLFSIPLKKTTEQPSQLERNTQFLRLDPERLHQLNVQRPEWITLNLPWHGAMLRVDLYQAQILAEDFNIETSGHETFAFTPGVYYRGIIRGEPDAVAAISFFEDEVIGVVSHPLWGNLNLGRLDQPGNRFDYVLFSDSDLPEKPHFECTDLTPDGWQPKKNIPHSKTEVTGCVRVFLEGDFALFQDKGSITNTVNYLTGLYNVVTTLYANESVSTVISQLYIWTTQDPYPSNSSADALSYFQSYRTSFNGDLAHLITLAGGGLGGRGYIDVLCAPGFNYAFSNIYSNYSSYPAYSWTINVVTHEMGHNLSSHHTHWCGWAGGAIDTCGPIAGYPTEGGCAPGPPPTNGGTMMSYCHLTSYGVNFTNGFGPLPGQAIRNAVTAASCLPAACPTYSCTAPANLTVSSITASSAVIGWNTVGGATSYNLQYRLSGTSAWTTVTGASNPYTLMGLSGSTLYEVQVQAVCGGNSSSYRVGIVFKTAASACAEPSDITTSSPTGATIDVDWTENGTATEWDVQYGTQGFSLGSGTTEHASSKPHTIGGLTSLTTYDVYVRSTCGGALGNSTWVGPYTFTSPLANDLSSGAIEIFVDQNCPGTNIYTNTGSTVSSGEFSPSSANGGYWDTNANNTVWFKFTAPSSGSVKITTDIAPLGTLSDTQIALYDNEIPTSIDQLLVSNEDGGTQGVGFAAVAYYSGLTPGSVYYIQVDGWNSAVGTFCIAVYETFVLPNPGTTCTSYTQTSVNGSATPDKWYNVYSQPTGYNIGQTVAAVKSPLNLGTVTVQEIRNSSVPTAPNGVKYMQRYYNINSTLNQGGPKQVRLFYSDSELNSLKTATGLTAKSADDLNISHYDGVSEDCTPNNNASTGTTLLTDVSATSIGSSGLFFLEFESPGFSEFGAVFGSASLPVELLYFRGMISGAENTFEWETAVEKGVAEFVLERSADGSGLWLEIGRLLPAAGSVFPKQYRLNDARPLGVGYYRLKINDLDGSVDYSNIVLLERALPNGLQSVYPNPAEQVLFAVFQSAGEITHTFRIWGPDGRILLEQPILLATGMNVLPFSIENLPAGLYYLAVPGAGALPFWKQ